MKIAFYNSIIYLETIESMAALGYRFEINNGKITKVYKPRKAVR